MQIVLLSMDRFLVGSLPGEMKDKRRLLRLWRLKVYKEAWEPPVQAGFHVLWGVYAVSAAKSHFYEDKYENK